MADRHDGAKGIRPKQKAEGELSTWPKHWVSIWREICENWGQMRTCAALSSVLGVVKSERKTKQFSESTGGGLKPTSCRAAHSYRQRGGLVHHEQILVFINYFDFLIRHWRFMARKKKGTDGTTGVLTGTVKHYDTQIASQSLDVPVHKKPPVWFVFQTKLATSTTMMHSLSFKRYLLLRVAGQ